MRRPRVAARSSITIITAIVSAGRIIDRSERRGARQARGMTSATPDSLLVGAFLPSPNHGERRGFARPDSVILHYTGMATAQGALDLLRDPKSELSSHYFVAGDGQVIQLVAQDRRARPPVRGV